MIDDDGLRRVLARQPGPVVADQVLHELRPSMRRARAGRRIAIGATAAVFVAAGGAAALTLGTDSTPQTLQLSAPFETDAVDVSTSAQSEVVPPRPAGDSSSSIDIATTTATSTATGSSTVPQVVARTTVAAPVPNAAVPTEPPPTLATTPPTTSQPSAPEPTTTMAVPAASTITSACGDVVVTVAGGTVRVASIEPRPGFEASVATDGPESVEVEFIGNTRTCEVHAELKPGGLDVEVQNPETDD